MNKIALEEHFGATDPNIVEQSATHFIPGPGRATATCSDHVKIARTNAQQLLRL